VGIPAPGGLALGARGTAEENWQVFGVSKHDFHMKNNRQSWMNHGKKQWFLAIFSLYD
jgi:hypothetical protein